MTARTRTAMALIALLAALGGGVWSLLLPRGEAPLAPASDACASIAAASGDPDPIRSPALAPVAPAPAPAVVPRLSPDALAALQELRPKGPEWTVVDEDGSPVAGVKVSYPIGMGVTNWTTSDANGRFHEPLLLGDRPTEKRRVPFSILEVPGPLTPALDCPRAFAPSQADRRIRLVRGGWIALRPVQSGERRARDGFCLRLRRVDGRAPERRLEARMDEPALFGPMVPGEYELSARAPGLGYLPAVRLHVDAGLTTSLGSVAMCRGASVRVQVRNEAGDPPGAIVFDLLDALHSGEDAWHDHEARRGVDPYSSTHVFLGAPPGDYHLIVSGDSYKSYVEQITIQDDQDVDRAVTLLPAGR